MEPLPVVIDNGSYEVRVGLAGDEVPRYVAPNCTARPRQQLRVLVADEIHSIRNQAQLEVTRPLERGVLFKKGPARFSRGAATALPSTRTGWTATGWSVSQPARPADGSAAAHRATWRGACTAAEWRRLGCLGSETTYCSGGGTSYQQVRPPRIAPATSQPITCTSLSQNTVANVSEFAFFVVLTRSAVLNAARPT